MNAGQVVYDPVTDQLTYEVDQQLNQPDFVDDLPYSSNRLARTDTIDENGSNLIDTGVREAEFEQVGDVIYGYHVGNYGLNVTKWELDSSGEMKGAQVVYTDGTTTKDLAEIYGITDVVDYPAVSPADGSSPTLATFGATSGVAGATETNWLQAVAGIPINDNTAGTIDAMNFSDMRGVETFQIDGQMYMFVATWSSNDGFAVFEVDSTTGLPTEMIGMVEAEVLTQLDGDDVNAVDAADFSDITVSKLDATGEYVITVGGGDGLYQFGFDPTKSSTQNQQGALEWIGVDKGSAQGGSSYSTDTDATNSAVSVSSAQTQFDILPDGKVLTTDLSGLWIGDPGLSVICFVAGTMILTDRGEVPVEQLETGDLVVTKDNGLKPVQWIGKRTQALASSYLKSRYAPVRIKAGALGNNLPQNDLYVSQQHRILVKSKIAARMMAFDEVLIPAKKLLGIEGIDIVTECDEVTYVHFLFDQHEIVYSNGAETESLFTGPEALKAVSPEAREEIRALFPELTSMNYEDLVGARIIPSGKIAKKLVNRIVKNEKPLYEVRH